MRYVDPDEVQLALPDDWDKTVEKAKSSVQRAVERRKAAAQKAGKTGDELDAEIRAARSKAISTKSEVWRLAGRYIAKVMDKKCWYCETRETRSDMPVDHFRPKNSVFETQGKHAGYWWLAFRWDNFRYCCTYCNSRRNDGSEGGKQDRFPLLDPATRAWTPGDDHTQEKTALLDPCVITDTQLLFFNAQGRAVAKPKIGGDDLKRVTISVETYHLNHEAIKKKRESIAIKMGQRIKLIEELDNRPTLSSFEIRQRKDAIIEILRAVRSSREFCSSARCFLKGYRHLEWVEQLIERNL